jgi:hypothetical protein
MPHILPLPGFCTVSGNQPWLTLYQKGNRVV